MRIGRLSPVRPPAPGRNDNEQASHEHGPEDDQPLVFRPGGETGHQTRQYHPSRGVVRGWRPVAQCQGDGRGQDEVRQRDVGELLAAQVEQVRRGQHDETPHVPAPAPECGQGRAEQPDDRQGKRQSHQCRDGRRVASQVGPAPGDRRGDQQGIVEVRCDQGGVERLRPNESPPR